MARSRSRLGHVNAAGLTPEELRGLARFVSEESIKIIGREGAKETAISFDHSVASGVANTVFARVSYNFPTWSEAP